jgi:hypothetical protein
MTDQADRPAVAAADLGRTPPSCDPPTPDELAALDALIGRPQRLPDL